MAPASTSYKRALSSAEEPVPKKPASSKHTAYLTRVGENDVAKSSTTDADALWRQLPIAKPLKHFDGYCLDRDCELHGRVAHSTVIDETVSGSKSHNTARAQHTGSLHSSAVQEALPARTTKQTARTAAKIASPRKSRKVDCRGNGCGDASCYGCWPQTGENTSWLKANGISLD